MSPVAGSPDMEDGLSAIADMATEASSSSAAVEDAKRRCTALRHRLLRISTSNNFFNATASLVRLINAERNFLDRLSLAPHTSTASFNIGHLEAVVHVLQQPFVTGVSRVCKKIAISASLSIYVDIVCSINGNPVWFIVSDRNPRYISWEGCSPHRNNNDKGLKEKIQQVVVAARESPVTLRPSSVILFCSNGLDDNIIQKLRYEFGAVDLEMEPITYEEVELEDEWTNVVPGRFFPNARGFRVEVKIVDGGIKEKKILGSGGIDGLNSCKKYDGYCDLKFGSSLGSLVSVMKCWCCPLDDNAELQLGSLSVDDAEVKLVNFDTTAMIAIVSGISNGGTEKLLATPENELRGRFKGNYEFVIAQVDSENHNPIHDELSAVLSEKCGIISESVHSEFQELVAMCGGPNEKLRAQYLLKFLKIVPDCPSTRLMSLATTRKLALKNKVVFGTGDFWSAPTVTANMAFVRAVAQTGMSLSVIEHRPRALIGD